MSVFDGGVFDRGVVDGESIDWIEDGWVDPGLYSVLPAFQTDAVQTDAFQALFTESAWVDLGTDYQIIAEVGASLETDYLLGAETIYADLGTDYQIYEFAAADQILDYRIHVGELLSKDFTTDYLIYAQVSSSSLTFDYQIVQETGLDLIVDYVLSPMAWARLTIDYKIASLEVGVDLTTDFRILDKAGVDLEVDYAIYGSLIAGASLSVNYAIDAIRNVIIRYDDVDITADLLYRECEFTSQTNGSVGTASILLKDTPFTHSFSTGKRLELYIGTELMWSGFVSNISREYPFSYEDLQGDVQALPRYMRLKASDINILFERRYTFNQTTHTLIEGPEFKANNTPDIDAIRQLCDAWLDLSGDGIDTVSMVEHVGEINVDQPANPFQAGQTWKDAMYQIASIPAAVFYLTPDRKLVYTDVDTITNDLILSDQPDDPILGTNGVGYRDARWTAFGDRMCNDYLAWGVAQNPVVFKRLEDDDSIALHGLWQDSVVNQTVYKQATINKLADRKLYGSPGSRRGNKDNRDSFTCSTFTPGFNVAQKVRVISNVYDFDDVLPIRQMRITFPTPTDPRYDLTLSHEIDVFGFFDVIRYKYPPKPKLPKLPKLPPIDPKPRRPSCVVLDSFSRSTNYTWERDSGVHSTGGWGTGEQLDWTITDAQVYVNGAAGVMDVREPMWVDHYNFGGGTITASADIPNGIDSNNIVIQFSLGRLERILPSGSVSTSAQGHSIFAWPMEWNDIPNASDYDPNVIDGFRVQNHWDTKAWIGPMVRDTDISASIGVSSSGPVVRTIYRGTQPQNGTWYHNNAGFWPGVSLWGSSGGETDGASNMEWDSSLIGPYAYWGGVGVSDLYHVGPDSSGFLFNQAVNVSFNVGGHITSIAKGHEMFGYSGDGLSRQAFGVQASAPGDPEFSGSMGMTIEPGYNYFLRVWRPDNDNVYTKLWYEGWDEPTDWQAYSGSHPPYGWVPLWVDEQWVEVPPDEPGGDPSWILIPGYWSQEWVEWPGGKPTNSTFTNQSIEIKAKIFSMTQYSLLIDGIYACTETADDVPIPYIKPKLPPGASFSEQFGMVSPEAGMHTIVPYIPKSLILHVNGTMQRKGIDYVEADPSKGTFTLLFTPDEGDKIIVRYLVS